MKPVPIRVRQRVLAALLTLAATTPLAAQSPLQSAPRPPEMDQLNFLLGRWTSEGEILDPEGNVTRRTSTKEAGFEPFLTEPILGGLVLEAGAGSDVGRIWYTYRPLEKQFVWVAVDQMGHFDHLRGGFEDGHLVLTEIEPHPWPDGGTMMYRRTYQEIRPDSHVVLMEISRDEGKTWTLYSRGRHQRLE